MSQRDPYEVLGISRNATQEEIKRAYRKLAKQYHPDRNRDDVQAATRFKEVRSAYDLLSDPKRRENYDRFGSPDGAAPFGGFRSGPAGERVYTWKAGAGPEVPIEDLDDLFDLFSRGGQAPGKSSREGLFEEFFRQGGQRASKARPATAETPRGRDLEHPVDLSFDQAINGTTLSLRLNAPGARVESSTIDVKIPPGVADGQRIRIRGKGHPGRPPGDLYIVCKVQPHRYFRRVGNDIYLDVPLSLTEAALGTRVEIPTLDGPTMLTIPPGTRSGAKLRLKGKGVRPTGKEPRGDQYAVIQIVPPAPPTPKQRELLEQLRDAGEESPRKPLNW